MERHNKISVLFRSRTQREKEYLYCRVTVGGKRWELSANIKLTDTDLKFSFPLQRFTNGKLKDLKNRELDAIDKRIQTCKIELMEKGKLTLENIKNMYLGKDDFVVTLIDLYDMFIEEKEKLLGYEVRISTLKTYKHRRFVFRGFLKERGLLDLKADQVNTNIARDFEIYCHTAKHYKQGYIRKCLQILKTVLNFAITKQEINKSPLNGYKIKDAKPTENVYLTEDELTRLEMYPYFSDTLQKVRDCFLFQCYTGLAYSDLVTLRWEHIQKDPQTQSYYIRKERVKTEIVCTIPLFPTAIELLFKYNKDIELKEKGLLLPVFSMQRMNSYLKEIQELLCVKKTFSSHLGRRTYATLLVNRGVSLNIVSKSLGHRKTATTELHYVSHQQGTIIKEIFSKMNITHQSSHINP